MNKNNEYTCDDLGIGGFVLRQPKRGYRFSVDAPILAALVPLLPRQEVLELGCGSGVIPLLMLGREPSLKVSAVEKTESSWHLAVENMKSNGVFAEILLGDAMEATSLFSGRTFDLILSNPPYYPVGACRLPKDETVAAAKTELYWDQRIMMEQVFLLLNEKGRFAVIFDGARKNEMISLGEEAGFSLCRVTDIFGKEGETAKSRVYLEFSKEQGLPTECDAFCIYDTQGELTPKMKRILKIYDGTGTVSCGNAHR